MLMPTTCLGYVPSVREIDAAIIPMLSRMERVGMMVDRPATEKFAGELEKELDEIRDRLSALLGSKTNPNSLKMADVLFRQLKLPVIKLTKAKTREAIDDDVLGALKAQLKKRPDSDDTRDLAIQVIDCITDYRERQKLLSTYCLPLLDKLDSDSRVHTTLKYTHVATGRLSSEDPNLQNIPNPDNSPIYGKRMRGLFVAKPGHKLISADYCLDPATLILTQDLRWVRADTLTEGQPIIGFDEDLSGGGARGSGAKFRRATIVSNARLMQPCYRITTNDGSVIASADHLWVARNAWIGKGAERRWVKTKDLKIGMSVCHVVSPWQEDDTRNGGYLAGFFDGEGWLSISDKKGASGGTLGFAQNPGVTLDKVRELLIERGFSFGESTDGSASCKKFYLRGQAAAMRFLGMIRPTRLMANADRLWEGRRTWGCTTKRSYITSIEFLGERGVCAVGTSTRTLIANGFLSHNSQIEMVVGAHITQDPGMLRVFRDGLDLHYYAASLMFDIPYDQVPKATRTQVKPLNFGAFYGLSAMGLQAQFASLPSGAIEKTEEECQELIDRYYSAFSSVMEWKRELWKWGQINGYVETLFGRKRQMPGLRSNIGKIRAAAERESGNQPIQGTAQDILRIGMRTLWEDSLPMFWAEGIDIQAINQVHDEILFEVEERAAEWVVPTIESAMRYAVGLSVPIKVGISVAENWAALK